MLDCCVFLFVTFAFLLRFRFSFLLLLSIVKLTKLEFCEYDDKSILGWWFKSLILEIALHVSINISLTLSGTLLGKIDEPILKKYEEILNLLQENGKYVNVAMVKFSREVTNNDFNDANLAGMGMVTVVDEVPRVVEYW